MSEARANGRAGSPRERSQLWQLIGSFAVTGVVLYLVARSFGGGYREIEVVLARARWQWLPAPVFLIGLSLLAAVESWRVVLRAMGHPLSRRLALFAYLAAFPVGVLTPARAGHALRALVLREHAPAWAVVGSVLMEIALDLQAVLLLALVGALLGGSLHWVAGVGGGLLALWILLLASPAVPRLLGAVPILERLRPVAQQLASPVRALIARPRYLVFASLWSIFAWTCGVGLIVSLLAIFVAEVSWFAVIAAWPIACLAGALPITIAGMGTRDAAFVALVSEHLHTPLDETAVLAATSSYALLAIWLVSLVALPVMLRAASQRRTSSPVKGDTAERDPE